MEVSIKGMKGTITCESNVKNAMRASFFTIIIFLLPASGYAQIGINSRYIFGKSDLLDQVSINQNGQHTSIEYNFRLKQKRVEFRPGIGYRSTFAGNNWDGHLNGMDVDFGVAVYPFDFGGDCNCPTFSKQGNLIKKGFFIEVIPGASYQGITRLRMEPDDPSRLPINSKNLIYKMGATVGLDIGISEHFTLTPLVGATQLTAAVWEGLLKNGSSANLKDYLYYTAGLRLTYSADDNKRRRRN